MKRMHKFLLAALVAAISISAGAQQVNTLYFLENSPMRHTINPAFQPVSKGYINFSPLGWTSMSLGNNSLTMSDVLFVDPTTGKTITPLHPNANKNLFLNAMRNVTYLNGGMSFSIINMGFRIKEQGYLMIGINQRLDGSTTLPKSIFDFFLGGGMQNLTGINTISLTGLGARATSYTEVGAGYSYKLNDQWTIGGKAKFLMGQAYGNMASSNLAIDASTKEWRLHGDVNMDIAAPVNYQYFNSYIDGKNVNQIINGFNDGSFDQNQFIDTRDPKALAMQLLNPSGYGAAFDFGFTYKPIENLQISAAFTDLGFIYWQRNNRYTAHVDTVFNGAGQIDYNDPAYRDAQGNFSTQILMDTVTNRLKGLLNGVTLQPGATGTARMTTARLNVGLDANFWDNRVGLGIVSATRLHNARLYEEVTIGVAFRPVNWFNIAASYSLLENGKYSNIGAGLGFMPYDGINLTLAMDYIPTSYAGMDNGKGGKMYILPDKAKTVNVALGFSIVWGSNRRDQDKDGVWDKIDMCPNTPRGVQVDSIGCPLDEDHDGVPDYLDHCLGTPAAAIGYVDSVGCALDTDGDGVEDYKDKCPNTPKEAYGMVDSVGCPIDTDGDGVPDYIDECPGTPEAAYGKVDAKGCPVDSDGDGVPDYLDECPGTPEAAYGKVDDKGCPIDTDGDGVPDYIDECPGTPEAARGHVDARGCELDTDGDGVPDYKDECPAVPGLKENKGCPELKREVRQLLQKAMQGIEFETGKATIKKKSHPLLNQIANIFIENKDYIVEIQGHTDNTGKYELNKTLSEKRANAVRDYLIAQGVDFQRLTAVGYGPDVPIADNKTKAGRAKNRRVEFKITFEEVHVETVLDHADPAPAAPATPADSTAVAQ